jgi:hypothetical protein
MCLTDRHRNEFNSMFVVVPVNRSKAGRAYLRRDNLDVTNNPSSCNIIISIFYIFINIM